MASLGTHVSPHTPQAARGVESARSARPRGPGGKLDCADVPTDDRCLRAGTQLHVSDIDPARMLVRVHHGKGGKDRLAPLAQRLREHLRAYGHWLRPQAWLFPAHTRQEPLPVDTL
jgi:hypothetical protein